MRPVRLEAQGFAAFRELTVVDFDSTDLFALVGPTGSGKSTVIDAMCFALYGTVPRYGDRRTIAPVITLGALEAKVSLTFELGGARYIATRVVRRTTQGASTKETRLEAVDGEVIAGSAREIDEAIEQLLGLSFEHFTRAVVLPQGEFARFLHDKPADRQQVLVKLLGLDVYERMGRAARELAGQHDADTKRAEQDLAKLADATPEARDAWKEWVAEYGALRAEVREARPEVDSLKTELAEAQRDAKAARELLALLRKVKVPAEVHSLAKKEEKAESARAAGIKACETAEAERKKCEAAVRELPEIKDLLAASEAHTDLARTRTERAAHEVRVAETAERSEQSETAVAGAEASVAEAEQAQTAAHDAHTAQAVARTLRAGEPCPVCLQTVATLPKHKGAPALDRAQKALDKARAALDKAVKARRTAENQLSAAQGKHEETVQREKALAARVAAHPDAEALGASIAAHKAAESELEAARNAEHAARRVADDAAKALDDVHLELKKAGGAFRDTRDALVRLKAEPPTVHDDLPADWRDLAEWAAAELPACEARVADAEQRAKTATTARAQRLAALVQRCTELELEVPGEAAAVSIDELLDLVGDAERDAKQHVDQLDADIKEAARLQKQLDTLANEVGVAKLLGDLLKAGGFERWLVSEALELLVTGASARLRELSGGQYSFVFDEGSRDFMVVDHGNADDRRTVRTLSGGETFQASLALALSLADQLGDLAADGAARLESIFLDEGFGTLDADTLETVAGTIERLGAGERMVGVITHVRELAERMPVQFKVTKGPRTSTVEKVVV